MKINTDGSWNPISAGFGGVVRNDKGNCIMFFSPSSATLALEAEAHAILMAVTIAASLNWYNLEIEIDSKLLFDILNSVKQEIWEISYYINCFKCFSSTISVTWKFIHRKGNRAANWAAQLGATTSNVIVGTTPPSSLKVQMNGDSLNAPYVRNVDG
ncbi:uncharacterized protein LOC110033496 [Phalaenopsis equestris]|uniref:uncharacterized protein LOC110033496 n=1 Tax=Phalaenopsis equestris TaxID=78828 RepID=UPI0009E4CB17|nr:uncharacterized protein LOC110033496 [Phalaenopsis equestris]